MSPRRPAEARAEATVEGLPELVIDGEVHEAVVAALADLLLGAMTREGVVTLLRRGPALVPQCHTHPMIDSETPEGVCPRALCSTPLPCAPTLPQAAREKE